MIFVKTQNLDSITRGSLRENWGALKGKLGDRQDYVSLFSTSCKVHEKPMMSVDGRSVAPTWLHRLFIDRSNARSLARLIDRS